MTSEVRCRQSAGQTHRLAVLALKGAIAAPNTRTAFIDSGGSAFEWAMGIISAALTHGQHGDLKRVDVEGFTIDEWTRTIVHRNGSVIEFC